MGKSEDRRLVAHLMRRAGFGATSSELDELSAVPYEQVVDTLLDPPDKSWMGEHLIRRFHHCLLYTSPSPRDATLSRMPSSA